MSFDNLGKNYDNACIEANVQYVKYNALCTFQTHNKCIYVLLNKSLISNAKLKSHPGPPWKAQKYFSSPIFNRITYQKCDNVHKTLNL